MAGTGVRLFLSGDLAYAADVNTYLMDQVVARFATTAARDAAFGDGIPVSQGGSGKPALSEGRICYIDDINLIQFYDGSSWQSSAQFTVGDGTITESKLADNSVTSAKIAPGTVIAADIAAGTVTATELADGAVTSGKILDGTIVNADINASAAIALSKLATGTQGTVVLHNSSGVPTATAISGDIGVTNAGVASISSGVIVNADINASAAIDLSKLATSTAGNIIVYNSSGVPTAVAETGDVTISDTGVTAISTGVIVNADINASAAIADTKLATISTAGKVSNSATTAASANTASAIVARDASGNFIAGKATLTTADVTTVVETANIVSASATGTINIDFSTNPTVYYTLNASANWTLNVRGTSGASLNSVISTGQIATVTFLATNGATPYRPTVFQVDGNSITPKWMGGTAPSAGNASSIDAYTLAIIKTADATFTMLASQTRFA